MGLTLSWKYHPQTTSLPRYKIHQKTCSYYSCDKKSCYQYSFFGYFFFTLIVTIIAACQSITIYCACLYIL